MLGNLHKYGRKCDCCRDAPQSEEDVPYTASGDPVVRKIGRTKTKHIFDQDHYRDCFCCMLVVAVDRICDSCSCGHYHAEVDKTEG